MLYKNAKPTELCSAVDIPAVNVRKVGAGVGSRRRFFGREGCSRHTIRVNAISCSSQSLGRLSLARPDRSSAYTSLLLDFEYSNHSNIHDKKKQSKKCDDNDDANAG